MRVLFNPTWEIRMPTSINDDDSPNRVPYTYLYAAGRDHEGYQPHKLYGFGFPQWCALIGQLVGTPVTGSSAVPCCNVAAATDYQDKRTLVEGHFGGNAGDRHSCILDDQGNEITIDDLDDDIVKNLALDIFDLLSAPLPGATPIGVPGQQLTIGGPFFGPFDATKRLSIDKSAQTVDNVTTDYYAATFWYENNSNTVAGYQMDMIFDALFRGVIDSTYQSDLPTQSRIWGFGQHYWIGILYNGSDNMVGIEIMGNKFGSNWWSNGALYNKSLVRFVWGFQIVMGRLLAALDAGRSQGGSGEEVDYQRIQNIVQTAVTASTQAIVSALTQAVQTEVASIATAVDQAHDDVSKQNGATQFNQAVALAVLCSAYRKAISPKRMNQAVNAISAQVYNDVARANPGDKQSTIQPNVLDVFTTLADKYGRLIDTTIQGDDNDESESESDD